VKTLHGHDHSVSGLQFTADGNFLVSFSRDKTLKIWDVKTGYCVKTITGASEWIKRVAVDVSGTLLASGGHDNLIKIWKIQNVSSGTLNVACELRGHEHHIESIDFSPRNCILNKKKKRKVRKQSAKERRGRRKKGEEEEGGGEEANGPGYDEERNGSLEKSTGLNSDINGNSITSNVNNPISEYLVSGSRDKSIKVWDVETGNEVMTLTGHDNWVRVVKFHPDGIHLISCGDDKTIRFWNLEQQRCVKEIKEAHDHFVQALDWWSEGGRDVMVTGGVDDVVKVWED